MNRSVFNGSAHDVGRQNGAKFKGEIAHNIGILVKREGYEPLPSSTPAFINWADRQEKLLAKEWPWLIEEMEGVAEGSGQQYHDVLLLNLRAWQYPIYACSNLVVTLRDGTPALAGALDDPADYYCGLVTRRPEQGYAHCAFPFSGTSHASRGVNQAGLALGIASQLFEGVNYGPEAINQDLAMRIILQTCATVKEVEEFCRSHPFTINIACVDAAGGVFCAHCVGADMLVVANSAPCALTNHLWDDEFLFRLSLKGCAAASDSPTTRPRRGRLLDFIRRRDGRCDAAEVMRFIADRDGGSISTICPRGNVCLTFANPATEKGRIHVSEPSISGVESWESHSLDD